MKSSSIKVPAKRGTLTSRTKKWTPSSTAESSTEQFDPIVSGQIGIDLQTDSEAPEAEEDSSVEYADIPKRHPKHYLIILDLNGVLVTREFLGKREPVGPKYQFGQRLGAFWVWRRPGIQHFLDYIFEHFQVAIWSSVTRKNIDPLAIFALGKEYYEKLLFIFDQTMCEALPNEEQPEKPLFMKNLTTVWAHFPPHDSSDTIIIDDSNAKLSRNPPDNCFVLNSWTNVDAEDNEMADSGELMIYMRDLVASMPLP